MSRQKRKKFWAKHIEAFRESGMSQRAYCQANSLNHRTLQYHLCKRRRKEAENHHSLEKHSGWLPMAIIDEPKTINPGGIRLQINRIIIEVERGFDSAHLTHVLQAVGAAC
jgi:hypothetical protein